MAPALARRDEEGLSSCFDVSLSSCRRFHPAEVDRRISRVATSHAAFEANQSSRPSEISNFEATHAFTWLRPEHSLTFLAKASSMGFEPTISRRLAIRATGLWLLP
jgi:hypothetical protein